VVVLEIDQHLPVADARDLCGVIAVVGVVHLFTHPDPFVLEIS
jgi:hypothetical protein